MLDNGFILLKIFVKIRQNVIMLCLIVHDSLLTEKIETNSFNKKNDHLPTMRG